MKKTRKPKGQKDWTMKEIVYLKNNSEKMTITQMTKQLERTYGSVRNKVSLLGLKGARKRDVLDFAYYDGDRLVCVGKINEVSEFTGISEKNLLLYRHDSIRGRGKRALIAIED